MWRLCEKSKGERALRVEGREQPKVYVRMCFSSHVVALGRERNTTIRVDRLFDMLSEEVRLFHGVRDQVEQMQKELKRMQCFLRDAERRQGEDESVRNWISEIKTLAYKAEDVIELYALKAAHGIIYKRVKYLHNVGSEILSINSQISDLTRSLQTYGVNVIRDREDSTFAFERQRELRWAYSHILEEHIVGLDENINQVVGWLVTEDKHCRVVYIYGMGGLGKTTLAKNVYHHDAIRRHFDGFAWAYVSQQCKKRDIWEGILLKLTSPTKEGRDEILKMRDDELAKRLYEVQKEKQCLIILDDIWSNEAWEILRPAFPSENTRSKLVFTSRTTDIALRVDPECLLHKIGYLNEDQSWALFQMKAFPRKDDSEYTISNDLERLGREMVVKCAGLPLAIIVLGGLLATKEDSLSEWKRVHRYLTSHLIRGEVPEIQSKLFDVLDLSYHDLPCQLKLCFLYLSQFPEDSEIPRNKLIRLLVSEGVVSSQYEIERDETMEDIAERYLGNLLSRCMIQVGRMGSTDRIRSYRLHDLMRDLCLTKAKQEDFMHIISGFQEDGRIDAKPVGDVRRLAIFLDQHVNQLIPCNHKSIEKVRSLLYFHENKCRLEGWKSMKKVFENFKLLRVLDLEGIKVKDGNCLPKEVGNLLWLKFLSLKKTYIRILPSSIGNLENLQTLNLQTVNKVTWDSSVQIPNVLWKMRRLRHLYLPKWCGNITDNLQLENLVNLQTLVNFPANKCDVRDLLKLSKLRKLVLNDPRCFQEFSEIFSPQNDKLEYLQSLSLKTEMFAFPKMVIELENLMLGCPSLHKLHIEGRIERLPEVPLFPPHLAKLTLWGSRLLEDPMVMLEKLPNLKFLDGWEMFIGKKMVCSQNGFPQLKFLALRGLPNLEEWTIENQAFPKLYRLAISDCYKLKIVPDGMKFVVSLRELEIRWMPKSFKTRIGNGGEDYDKIQHVPNIAFLDYVCNTRFDNTYQWLSSPDQEVTDSDESACKDNVTDI
ncbi:putative disease resistance protein [Senna tora]|uniref:Putative disease resistance protein n=1 Tax=Senna tora TaxID=362788 RepID=A0A834WEN0_9FABA|nr:putative disease resistance protein [Senna tora]